MPTYTASGIPCTWKIFRDEVNKIVSTREGMAQELAFGAGVILNKFREGNRITEDRITPSAVAATLIAALECSGDELIVDDRADKVIVLEPLARDFSIAAEGMRPDKNGESARDAAFKEFTWIAYSSHVYQGDFAHRVANALVISGVSGFNGLEPDSERIDKLFNEHMNVQNVNEYLALLISLWVIGNRDLFVRTERFLEKCANKERLKPALESLFIELGLSWKRNERVTQLSQLPKGVSGKAYPEAALLRYPLVRLSPNRVMVAGDAYLSCQLADKFITKCQFLGRMSSGKQNDIFTSEFLGPRFERFFRELLLECKPKFLGDEFTCLSKKGEIKSPDFIMSEDSASRSPVVTLFQLKCRFMREACTSGAAVDVLEDEMSKSAETLYKSIEFLYSVKHGRLSERNLKDSGDDVAKRSVALMREAKKIYLVGMYPSMPPIYVLPPYREKLIAIVKTKLDPVVFSWFEANLGRTIFWHIMDLEEFQMFMTLPSNMRNFAYQLRGYLSSNDLTSPLRELNGIPPSFRNHVVKISRKANGGTLEPLSGLYNVFNEKLTKVMDILGLKDAGDLDIGVIKP